MPVGGERERCRHLDDDPRTLIDAAAAPRAQRRSDDRLVESAYRVGQRRLEMNQVPLRERRERPALRLEREVTTGVVADLMNGIDRSELERHGALDDAQD